MLLDKAIQISDIHKKGYLTKEDLKVAMLFLFGYKPCKYEVDQLMRCEKQNVNTSIKDSMSYQTFTNIMLTKLKSQCEEQKIRDLFCMLDVKCQGYLDFNDIQTAFKQSAPTIAVSTIASCFQEMCMHNDKKVSFREFERIMKSSMPD